MKWFKVFCLPPKDWDIPLGEHLDALSKDELHGIPLGSSFTSSASRLARMVRATAANTIRKKEDSALSRIKIGVRTGKIILPQERMLSIKVEVLRALNLELRGINWYLETPLSRIRRYTFFCATRFLGEIPFHVLIAFGALLYNQDDTELIELFNGLSPGDKRQFSKKREEAWKLVEWHFLKPEGVQWGPEYLMRPASDVEQKHMELVLNGVAADIYEQHSSSFCDLYKEVFSSNSIAAEHRRMSEIEEKAEHLIACITCSGIPRLMNKRYVEEEGKGTTAPNLVLHVPEYFQTVY